jgi:hypothetical protein
MIPLYIFDLDGTLADIRHRRHFVEGEKKDWRAFFAACVDDEPMRGVITTLNMLSSLADIWIWSGRSDEVELETLSWLGRHCEKWPAKVRMRRAGDHQPDEKLKASWLAEMSDHDRGRLVAIFEDRDRMVKLWRDNGIQCFQVAPGDF